MTCTRSDDVELHRNFSINNTDLESLLRYAKHNNDKALIIQIEQEQADRLYFKIMDSGLAMMRKTLTNLERPNTDGK